MNDPHDCKSTVRVGGREYVIAATNRACKVYADRFRDDAGALGASSTYEAKKTKAKGKERTERVLVPYTGALVHDVNVSRFSDTSKSLEVPQQVVAATWAMARAAGSTDDSYEEFVGAWLDAPADANEATELFLEVCVRLYDRAFFRSQAGQDDAREPDEGEAAQG